MSDSGSEPTAAPAPSPLASQARAQAQPASSDPRAPSAPREARIPLFDAADPWLRAGASANGPRPAHGHAPESHPHAHPHPHPHAHPPLAHPPLAHPPLAHRDAIDRALTGARGARRVVLAGDREGLHPEIGALVARAAALGADEVAVEAPPHAFVGDAAPETLAAHGTHVAIAVVGGMRRRVFEHTLAAPGAFDAAMRGLAALSESALALEIVFPLYATTLDDAAPFVEWLVDAKLDVREIHLAVPPIQAFEPRRQRLLAPFAAQATVAADVFARARRAGIRYGFVDRRAPSPCAGTEALDPFGFVFHERVRHLQHHDRASLVRVDACATCSLGDACPGIERAWVARFGESELAPVPLDRSLAWRLRRTDQVAQEYRHVSPFSNATDAGGRSLVRVNGHCQMACSFCFVDRTVPDFDTDELERAFEGLATRHTDHLVLSGGEPTLHPDLARLIARGRALGFRTIEIQTNGVRSADRAYAESLVAAGLNKVTVSLHSRDPATSDEITKMKGAFPKTVEALHHFRALGVETQIAHVITKANYRELPGFVRWLTETFPPREAHLSLCLALAQGISDLVYSWAIPRFDEVKPFVRDALDHCIEAGLGFGGLVGQGGYPPCMLDGELRYYENVLAHLYVSDDHDAQFHKAERCAECSFDPWCVGVRNDYVRTYGDAELRPFRADVSRLEHRSKLVSKDRLVRARRATQAAVHAPEQLAFGLGMKPALRLVLTDATGEKARARARGLHVAEGADDAGRTILYVARSASLAEALRDAEAKSRVPSDASVEAHRALGALLGYPDCCVEAFVARLRRGALAGELAEDFVATRDALARSARTHAILNVTPLDRGPAVLSHYPCAFDCAPSLAYARAVLAELDARAPDVARAVRARVAAPVAIEPDGRRRPPTEASPDAVRPFSDPA